MTARATSTYSPADLGRLARISARRGGLTRGRVTWALMLIQRSDPVSVSAVLIASALTAEGTPRSVTVAL